jgi:hypothetical protein
MATKLPAAERDISPPEFALLKSVSVNTVLGWIKSGELKATNLASRTSRRPRYRISPAARRDFEIGRSVVPVTTSGVGRLRRQSSAVKKNYFS